MSSNPLFFIMVIIIKSQIVFTHEAVWWIPSLHFWVSNLFWSIYRSLFLYLFMNSNQLFSIMLIIFKSQSYSQYETVWWIFCLHFWVNTLFWSIYRFVASYLSIWVWQYDINGRSVWVRKHPGRLIVPTRKVDGPLLLSHINRIISSWEITTLFSDNDWWETICLDSRLPLCWGIAKIFCVPIFALLTHIICPMLFAGGIWNRYLC